MLSIDDLRVLYAHPRSPVEAVAGLSLEVPPGRAVALVGESGSGKSTVVAALLGLLPPSARVSGRLILDGVDVLKASPDALRGLRGRCVGFVGQAPHSAFDPLFPVDAQLREAWRAHQADRDAEDGPGDDEEMEEAVEAALEAAGLDLSGAAAGLPPHRMSGGMLQRAQIAAAMLHRPPLLVADEPTSALDTVLTRRLVDRLRALKSGGTSLLLATHDLGLASELADEVVVMRAGRAVERGPWAEVLGNPKDAYTLALVAAHPSRGLRVRPGVTA
jgi:peptide/nickel transport system ATP-binding protein